MNTLKELYDIIEDRKNNPKEESYTNKLLDHPEKVYRKINEETYEVIHACISEGKEQVLYEAGDLIYHLFTCLVKHGVTWDEVLEELDKRKK
ncbi:MAG: phosphoribosyl-ATP diphosphatase [Planctomycetota bacterium]|jgi:phosphoribosyl-ATP pyrophosphohydrolase